MQEEELKRLLEDHEERIKKLESKREKDLSDNIIPTEKPKSLREFFKEYRSKNDTDKTLIIIKFYEAFKGDSAITVKEISQGFKEMREKLPQNISDKLQLLDKRGLAMPIEKKGRFKCWVLTNSGEKYLRDKLEGDKR